MIKGCKSCKHSEYYLPDNRLICPFLKEVEPKDFNMKIAGYTYLEANLAYGCGDYSPGNCADKKKEAIQERISELEEELEELKGFLDE